MLFAILNSIDLSTLEIEVVTVSIPLTTLFILLYFFVLRKRSNVTKTVTTPSTPPSPLPTPPVQQVEQRQVQEIDLNKVMSKMDKMQSDLSKTIADSNNEIKNLFENLAKNIEDLALSIKATKSDEESPFNIIAEEKNNLTPMKKFEAREEQKESVSNLISSSSSSSSLNLKKIVQLSTLLAVMDYDKEKLMALYKLDLLSALDFELLVKIEDILAKNKKINASDLAIIAFDLLKSYDSADPDAVKYVSLVLGDQNGGRDNK